ncbi:hypothetical protein EDB83DRAFT_784718 [Lactarius deliciosus]|nr:hypothetical protein EDB83DRAFT_784718 [Lactarius deliciosus]
MRKRWIHRSMEGLPPVSSSVSPCGSNISLGSVLDEGQTEVDLVSSDTKDMLTPPMPANLDATTVSSVPHSSSPRVLTNNLSSLSSAQTPDLLASPSPSTPFANLVSPTASYSSNSSALSPKLSTLKSSFLSITSTLAFSPDADPPRFRWTRIHTIPNRRDIRCYSMRVHHHRGHFFRASLACAASTDEPSGLAASCVTFAPNLISFRAPVGCRTTPSALIPTHRCIVSPSIAAGSAES